jgi:hypothetical protein
MIKSHESEAGQSPAVFLILILLISNRYNFADFYATALKFRLFTNLSMLFQTMSMMSFITAGQKTYAYLYVEETELVSLNVVPIQIFGE